MTYSPNKTTHPLESTHRRLRGRAHKAADRLCRELQVDPVRERVVGSRGQSSHVGVRPRRELN